MWDTEVQARIIEETCKGKASHIIWGLGCPIDIYRWMRKPTSTQLPFISGRVATQPLIASHCNHVIFLLRLAMSLICRTSRTFRSDEVRATSSPEAGGDAALTRSIIRCPTYQGLSGGDRTSSCETNKNHFAPLHWGNDTINGIHYLTPQ